MQLIYSQLRNKLNEVVVSWPRLDGLEPDSFKGKRWSSFTSETFITCRGERQLLVAITDTWLLLAENIDHQGPTESVFHGFSFTSSVSTAEKVASQKLQKGNIHSRSCWLGGLHFVRTLVSGCFTPLNLPELDSSHNSHRFDLHLPPTAWVSKCGSVFHGLHNYWRPSKDPEHMNQIPFCSICFVF